MPKAQSKADAPKQMNEEVATPVAPQVISKVEVKDKPKTESQSISDLMKKLIIIDN
jgi:hypothetical protein